MDTNFKNWKVRRRRYKLNSIGKFIVTLIAVIFLLLIMNIDARIDNHNANKIIESQAVEIALLQDKVASLEKESVIVATVPPDDISPVEEEVVDVFSEQTVISATENIYDIPTYENVQAFDLLTSSPYISEEIDAVLSNTGLFGLGCDYRKAEDDTGVNAIFIIAISAMESGWGKSELSIKKNNLFGWCAYDDSFQSATAFATKGECVSTVAKALHTNYLMEDGQHFNGATVSGVGTKYASANHWSDVVGKIMVQLYAKLEANRVTE